MSRFVALDVETPNVRNDRMSAIGLTVVEDGRIADSFFSLVNPEQPFDAFHTRLTGISRETVRNAPTFLALLPSVASRLEGGLLAARNAVFDLSVLKKCLQGYGVGWKRYARYLCTVQMSRRLLPGMGHRLNELCDYYGIALDHHRADSDSRACAEILLRYLEAGADIRQHIRTYSFIK